VTRLRVGVVGCGFICQVAHLPSLASNSKVELVALADKRTALANMVSRRYSVASVYSHHKDMLSSESLDAIFVITRRVHTFEVVKDFLASGHAVFSEKPMAQTRDNAEELVSLADERVTTYSVGYMRRFDSGVRRLRTFLESDHQLGPLLNFFMELIGGDDYCGIGPFVTSTEPKPLIGSYPRAPVNLPDHLKIEYERFLNVCGHNINLLRFILGDDCLVSDVSHSVNGFSTARLSFAGVDGNFSWRFDPRLSVWYEQLVMNFERGRVTLKLPPAFLRNQCGTLLIENFDSRKSVLHDSDNSWSFKNEVDDFVENCINESSSSINSGRECLGDYKIIDSIWHCLT